MAICPGCNKEFNEWFSRDKGKPQEHPYKNCYNCKQKRTEQPQGGGGNAADTALLTEIRDILLRMEFKGEKKPVGEWSDDPNTSSEN
jgi:hypothetical protein|tara:strand:+ start:4986 stop:5246 length:261 start_codon:yes stop_codon:yes gene_type:complete